MSRADESREAYLHLQSFSKEDFRLFFDFAQMYFQKKDVHMSIFELRSIVHQLKDGIDVGKIKTMPNPMCVLVLATVKYWNKRMRKQETPSI